MARLNAAPWTRYRSPSYPTRLEVMADRQLLARHVPPAWLSHRELAGAFGALLLAAPAGCTDRSTSATKPAGTPVSAPASAPAATNPTERRKAAVVAPIFEHGEGNGPIGGGIGCIVVAAPVYLSEEEALQIIQEELATSGLNMSKRDVTYTPLFIQGRRLQPSYEWASGDQGSTLVDASGPLVVDLEDPRHKVAVEYVGIEDFYPLGGDRSSKIRGDVKAVASALAHRVSRDGDDLRFGAFYDPVTFYNFTTPMEIVQSSNAASEPAAVVRDREPSTPDEALTESKRLLRMQVRDFVDWLKAQRVI